MKQNYLGERKDKTQIRQTERDFNTQATRYGKALFTAESSKEEILTGKGGDKCCCCCCSCSCSGGSANGKEK